MAFSSHAVVPFIGRRPRGQIRRGMTFAFIEGTVAGAMFGALDTWMVPLLQVHLGAGASAIGLLVVMPQLLGIGLGPLAGRINRLLGGDHAAAWRLATLQALLLLGLSVPLHARDAAWAAPVALVLAMGVTVAGLMGSPGWMAVMGGIIPRRVMGRFAGRRNRSFHACRLLAIGVYALIMKGEPATTSPWGLQAVILIAVVSRFISVSLLRVQPVGTIGVNGADSGAMPAPDGGFLQFLRLITTTPFGRFTLVWAVFQSGLQLAVPFFTVFLVQPLSAGGLGLASEPLIFSGILATAPLVRLMIYPMVGSLADKCGPAATLRLAIWVLLLPPLGCLVSDGWWSVLLAEVIAGFGWSLAEVSLQPLLFGSHSDAAQRARLVGRYQSVLMTAIVTGGGLGTLLMSQSLLPPWQGSPYRTLMAVSFLARIPAAIIACRFLPALRRG